MATGDSNEDREMQRSPLPQGLEYPKSPMAMKTQRSHCKAEQAFSIQSSWPQHAAEATPILWSSHPVGLFVSRRLTGVSSVAYGQSSLF